MDLTRRRAAVVQHQHAERDPFGIEPVTDGVRADRRDDEVGGVHRLATFESDRGIRPHAREGEQQPQERCEGFLHLEISPMKTGGGGMCNPILISLWHRPLRLRLPLPRFVFAPPRTGRACGDELSRPGGASFVVLHPLQLLNRAAQLPPVRALHGGHLGRRFRDQYRVSGPAFAQQLVHIPVQCLRRIRADHPRLAEGKIRRVIHALPFTRVSRVLRAPRIEAGLGTPHYGKHLARLLILHELRIAGESAQIFFAVDLIGERRNLFECCVRV